MKMIVRFSIHFVAGILAWMLSMGIIMMLAVDLFFPFAGITEDNRYYDFYVLLLFLIDIIGWGIVFSWYFGGPLWFILSWISNLSQEIYEPPYSKSKVYKRNDKLKRPYRLFEEVIANIHCLSNSLKLAKQDRDKLEEAKKDWLAGISHDLKTPLTYVTGYSALLLNEEYTWSEEEKRAFIMEIHNKGRHMEELIQDLNLSLQMNNSQTPLPISLHKLNIVEFMREVMADTANDPRAMPYELSFHSEEDCIEINADDKLLYRAMQNLIMNAIVHNPAGTSIDIALTRENHRWVRISISDNGIGMDQDTLDQLFTKYYHGPTSGSSRFGTGLGMAIVKSLILAHGGHLTVESELSNGTTFHIMLPLEELPDTPPS